MRLRFLFIGILALAAGTIAQTPTTTDLHLRGDRFRPLTASGAFVVGRARDIKRSF
jgi:hypothetical protein